MITLEYIRINHPELADLNDEEVESALEDLYGLADLAWEKWVSERKGNI